MLCAQPIDQQIINHRTIRQQQVGVMGFAHFQSTDVICRHRIQKFNDVWPGGIKHAHVGGIKKTGGGTHGRMLLPHRRFIAHRHLIPGKGHDTAAQFQMRLVQGGAFQGGIGRFFPGKGRQGFPARTMLHPHKKRFAVRIGGHALYTAAVMGFGNGFTQFIFRRKRQPEHGYRPVQLGIQIAKVHIPIRQPRQPIPGQNRHRLVIQLQVVSILSQAIQHAIIIQARAKNVRRL